MFGFLASRKVDVADENGKWITFDNERAAMGYINKRRSSMEIVKPSEYLNLTMKPNPYGQTGSGLMNPMNPVIKGEVRFIDGRIEIWSPQISWMTKEEWQVAKEWIDRQFEESAR